ncbi:uncharacterized protein EV420DRAFT_1232057, partial [Desarmillaria tabescens]
EYEDSMNSVEVFLTSCTLLEHPFKVITALIYSLFVLISTNLGKTVSISFITALNGLCIVNTRESLSMMMDTFLTQGMGLAITNILVFIAMYMEGLMSLNMLDSLKALDKLNPLK